MLPLLPLRLAWRARKEPGYAQHVGERFGRYPDGPHEGIVLWIHAVSLGETRAAAPLIERMLQEFPESTLLLTHMTATGRAAGHAMFGERVVQAWLPYDLPFAVRGFLARFRPRAGIIMETELWPNLVAAMRAAGIPLFLVNARLSARSARGYARAPGLVRPMLAALSGVAAQAGADAHRLAALGAPSPIVTGNLKFDVAVPDAAIARGRELRARFGDGRPVLVAGCTRDGEEAMLLDALAQSPLPDNALVVIVPRHPQRFATVAELFARRGVPFARRSDNAPVAADVGVVLGDSMGEMPAYYAAADVVFVGGGLAAARRAQSHRSDRRGQADARRTAHVQLRRSDGQRARRGRGGRGRRRERAGHDRGVTAARPGAARFDAGGRSRLSRGAQRRRRPSVGVARAAARGGRAPSA